MENTAENAARPRGGPRSAGTRAAILAAARTQFAALGYERTTIRGVAAAAGIDPSMVMRYYSSKAGLFSAAADLDLGLPDLTGVARRDMGAVLVRHFVELWESELADTVLALMLRGAATDDAAAERMRQIFTSQVVGPITAALAEPDARQRAGLIGAQLIGMALCRYLLRLEPIASAPAEDVIADLSPTVQRYLTEPLPSAGQNSAGQNSAGQNSADQNSATSRGCPGA